MKNKFFLALLLAVLLSVTGCQKKPIEKIKPSYDKPLLPGQNALRKITNPYEIPDFTMACLDVAGLQDAVMRSLNYLAKPSSQQFFPSNGITHSHATESLEEFLKLLDMGLTGTELNAAIQYKFDVYMSVGYDNNGTVLFTGYYTPIFNGSFVHTERFKYPLYKQPADLVKSPTGEILGRKESDGRLTQYPPRAVIEQSMMLDGSELIWLEDPFEVYIAHVQGSAKIRTPDSKLIGIGYAANNGHEYSSISKEMLKDGKLRSGQMSLSAMIDYFKRHRDQIAAYINRNKRYVFFRKEDGPVRGSLNEPVTTMRTIATDKSIFPRGSLTFLSTRLPQEADGRIATQFYSGFALDQDTGGAIRAPGRCDVYMGQGDKAGKMAGQTYQEGKLYYLFLKSSIFTEY